MDRPVAILSGVGVLLTATAVYTGGLSTGYGQGPRPILLRIGVAFVVLAILTARSPPLTVRTGVVNAAATLVVVFLVGAAVMCYDLGIRPPEYGTTLTLGRLVNTQLELLLVTLPVPAGYVSGVLVRNGKLPHAIATLLIAVTAGAGIGTSIALARGSAPGFTQTYFLMATGAASVFALCPVVVLGWLTPTRTTAAVS